LMIGVIIFLSTLHKDEEAALRAPELTPDQIQTAIMAPERPVPLDPRKSQQELETASQLFNKLDTSPANLYRAYNAYQKALAYSGAKDFSDGLDQRRYLQLQESLVQQVTKLYAEGYARLRTRQYKEAEATFRRLAQEVYPDFDSPIYRNVEMHRGTAAEGLKKRKR
jgi:hypothetical protein